jgi:hypothetical protein
MTMTKGMDAAAAGLLRKSVVLQAIPNEIQSLAWANLRLLFSPVFLVHI